MSDTPSTRPGAGLPAVPQGPQASLTLAREASAHLRRAQADLRRLAALAAREGWSEATGSTRDNLGRALNVVANLDSIVHEVVLDLTPCPDVEG